MSISSSPNGFLDLPARPSKPREIGITHVMDKGLGLSAVESLLASAGDYVDIVKLGWGTSYVTQNLREKLALYRSLDIPVICGGTLLEIAEARGKLDGYQKTISLISNRINQMGSYVNTRSSIAKHLEIEKDLSSLFEYKFETLTDTLTYIKEIWKMTGDYLSQAIAHGFSFRLIRSHDSVYGR